MSIHSNHIAKRSVAKGSVLLLLCVCLVACINDDLSKCPPVGNDFTLNYSIRLTTELTLSLQEEINAQTEPALYSALEGYLQQVFTDKAHDVDLHFYDLTTGASEHRESHIIDATEASITITLSKDEYMHLAVANIAENSAIALTDTSSSRTEKLEYVVPQKSKKTIQQHNNTTIRQQTGIFTARLPMQVRQDTDQVFNVTLYMANAATVLVLDTIGSSVQDVLVQVEQTASAFMVQDSLFLFDTSRPVEAERLPSQNTPMLFAAVSFPSSDTGEWDLRVSTYDNTGQQAQTILTIPEPLRAGTLRIIRAKVEPTGIIQTDMTNIGVSVTLEWKNGSEHEIDL